MIFQIAPLFEYDDDLGETTELHAHFARILKERHYEEDNGLDPDAFGDEVNLLKLVKQGNFALLAPQLYISYWMLSFYNQTTKENILDYVQESPYEFYIASLIPKTSPFTLRFNEITSRIGKENSKIEIIF